MTKLSTYNNRSYADQQYARSGNNVDDGKRVDVFLFTRQDRYVRVWARKMNDFKHGTHQIKLKPSPHEKESR